MALRDKHERPGRNPQTGKALTIEARRVLAFKTSPRLKEALNAHAEVPEDDEAADVVDQRVGGRTRRR